MTTRVRSFIAKKGGGLRAAGAIEPEAEKADEERRGEKVDEKQAVFEGVDAFAQGEADLFGGILRLLAGLVQVGDAAAQRFLDLLVAGVGLGHDGADGAQRFLQRRADALDPGELTDLTVESRLQALPPAERQALLLTTLEGFSVEQAAEILKVPEATASALVADAWSMVNQQMATTILIIEDEPVIALDIAGLVNDMGHSVVGVAASQSEAVQIARKAQPGLVLADIDLGAGGSGLTAVKSILQSMTVPVIFVTAYPERLLTGERPEPTYLVTKPFEPDTLKVTISQALSFFGTRPQETRQAV